MAQPYVLHHVSCHSKVYVKVSIVTSWLTAWESFPFVQFPRGEKMELLSYSSIRQIWMEGIGLSSQRMPNPQCFSKTAWKVRARRQGPRFLKLILHRISPHLNITARTLTEQLRQVKRNQLWGLLQSFCLTQKLKNKRP